MLNEDLIPPPELLFDGTGTREAFIEGGPGFLWNSLVARGGLKPEHAVLDIGSGNGKHARVLAEYLKGAGSYDGFDIVPEGIRWCQERYRRFENFRFTLADVHSDWYKPDSTVRPEEYVFPYGDARFDLAFAASLFTHLEPPAAANYVRQAARVLKPGGRLLMTCFLIHSGVNLSAAQDVQGQRFVRQSEQHHVIDPASPSRGVAFEEVTIRRILAEAGLRVAEITFGTWFNGIDHLGAFQDAIVAIKPV